MKTEDYLFLLKTVKNPKPNREYSIKFTFPEFTSICPVTGKPDFAEIKIEYTPDELLLEQVSVEAYLQQYRNDKIYMEAVTNKILDDFNAVITPKWMRITIDFSRREGMFYTVSAQVENDDILDFLKQLI